MDAIETDSNDEVFTMAYADTCSDIVVLLIHGFPLSGRIWEPQLHDLGGMARLVAPDLHGFGESDPHSTPPSIADYADACAGLMDVLAVDSYIVAGHSMGGYVALELLRRHPERVEGLILVSTKAGADDEEARTARAAAAEKARRPGGVEEIATRMLAKMLGPESREEDPELEDDVREIMEDANPDGVAAALLAMRDRADFTAELAKIAVPTLVVHGGDDAIIPVSEARAMAETIPGAELAILPDCGHLPTLERPDDFNVAVADFLERLTE